MQSLSPQILLGPFLNTLSHLLCIMVLNGPKLFWIYCSSYDLCVVKNRCLRWNCNFFEVELQNKPQTQNRTTCYGKQHCFKKDLCWSWPIAKRNVLETSAVPSNVNKMCSSTCFISRTYDRENTEINERNYLKTKEMQINFTCAISLLATVTSATNAHLKDQLSKIRHVITHHSWSDASYTEMGNQSWEVRVLKLVSAIFLSNFYFSPNDSPSKTIKNVFYFI